MAFGALICTFIHDEGSVTLPGSVHQIWIDGAYPDTCSLRSKFTRASQRLGLPNVALIGVGATG